MHCGVPQWDFQKHWYISVHLENDPVSLLVGAGVLVCNSVLNHSFLFNNQMFEKSRNCQDGSRGANATNFAMIKILCFVHPCCTWKWITECKNNILLFGTLAQQSTSTIGEVKDKISVLSPCFLTAAGLTSVPTVVIHTAFIAAYSIVSLCSDQSSVKWVNNKIKRVYNQITISNWSAQALLELCNERKNRALVSVVKAKPLYLTRKTHCYIGTFSVNLNYKLLCIIKIRATEKPYSMDRL